MSKTEQLKLLADKRKRATPPTGYAQISKYHNRAYECDHVSPYTKSAGNTNADVFILLQDWASDDALSGELCKDSIEFGHTRTRPTNINLKLLLKEHFDLTLDKTYATNLVPFIKEGSMSDSLKLSNEVLARLATDYALRQIEIVQPKLVICLGAAPYNSVRRALNFHEVKTFRKGIEEPFDYSNEKFKIRFWGQYHTSRWNGGKQNIHRNWKRMTSEFRNL